MGDANVGAMNEVLYDVRDPAIRALEITVHHFGRDLRLIDISSQ